MSETTEASTLTQRLQERLDATAAEAPGATPVVPVIPVEPATPVVPVTPVTPVEPAAPVTPVTTTEPVVPAEPAKPAKKLDFLSVLKNPELTQEDPLEKKYREKFEKEYAQDLQLAQTVKNDKFALDYAKYKNDPNFDPRKLLIVNTTDYSNYTPAQMHLETLKAKGVVLQGEDLEKEIAGIEEKINSMLPGEKQAYISSLKEAMPKPEDPMARWNEFVAEKEKSDAEYIGKLESSAKELSVYATTIAGTEFGGVEIGADKVRAVLAETYEEWNSGLYNPKAKEILEDRVLAAHVKENWDEIVKNIAKAAEIQFLAVRTNATPGTTTTAPTQTGLTDAQEAQISKIKGIYHSNPQLMEQRLREAGLPVNS